MPITPEGARRRVTALQFNGWSPAALAAETGLDEKVFRWSPDALRHRQGNHLEAIGEAFSRLWNTPPPQRTEAERASAELHAAHARKVGWAPPMAYDDDLIDDPEKGAAVPGWRRPAAERAWSRAADMAEDIAFLREVDGAYRYAGPAELADRLGRSSRSVERAMYYQQAQHRDSQMEMEAG